MAARWLMLLVLAPALALGAANQARLPPHQPDPLTWQPLPHGGLNGAREAIAVLGNDLYVGGFFTETADGQVQNLNHIAKFSSGAWAPLPGNGLNRSVAVLAFNGNDCIWVRPYPPRGP
jgi:hypothetical protein